VALVLLQWRVEPVDVNDMALWHVLILICVALPIGSALASARYVNVAPGGYLLAAAVGLVVGACCGWVMWKTHWVVGSKVQRHFSHAPLASQEWYFRAFYLAKLVWVGLAGFLGFWLSLALLRVVF
jgi:hypothetical protein